jgi:Flp pilus assembly protein TadB
VSELKIDHRDCNCGCNSNRQKRREREKCVTPRLLDIIVRQIKEGVEGTVPPHIVALDTDESIANDWGVIRLRVRES